MRASSVPIPTGSRKPGESGVNSLAVLRDEWGKAEDRAAPRRAAGDRRGRAPSEQGPHTCSASRVVCAGRAAAAREAAAREAEPSLPHSRPAVREPGGPGSPAPARPCRSPAI